MLSGFRPGPPVRGAFFCLTAWCGRGGIGGPPPALFGPPPGPPPPPRWPVLAPPGSALGPRRYAARSGRPAHPGGPSGPLCGPLRPRWGLRAPGALLGPLRLSRPRAARRGVPPAPCGGRRRLVPAPPPPRGPSRARPGRWRRGPPSGAWPGACPGLVPPRAPHPAAGWGPWPRRRVAVTAGPCS